MAGGTAGGATVAAITVAQFLVVLAGREAFDAFRRRRSVGLPALP